MALFLRVVFFFTLLLAVSGLKGLGSVARAARPAASSVARSLTTNGANGVAKATAPTTNVAANPAASVKKPPTFGQIALMDWDPNVYPRTEHWDNAKYVTPEQEAKNATEFEAWARTTGQRATAAIGLMAAGLGYLAMTSSEPHADSSASSGSPQALTEKAYEKKTADLLRKQRRELICLIASKR